MPKIARLVVVLKLATVIAKLIEQAEAIVAAMTANAALFVTPNPTLASVTAAIEALRAAQSVVATGVKGSVDVRNHRRDALKMLLRGLQAYVQTLVDANYAEGVHIAQAANMSIRGQGGRGKNKQAVERGEAHGSVLLTVPVDPTASSYEFQYSINQQTWTDVPPSTRSTVTITGLTPGVLHYFRHRVVASKGRVGNWSDPVSLMVA